MNQLKNFMGICALCLPCFSIYPIVASAQAPGTAPAAPASTTPLPPPAAAQPATVPPAAPSEAQPPAKPADVVHAVEKKGPAIPWKAPSEWLLYLVPLVAFFCALIGILSIKKSLPSNWSLADALSEEVAIKPATKTTTTKGLNGGPDVVVEEQLLDKDGKPVLLPEMRASSSRVIALMGMVAILIMYIGFGTFALYAYGISGEVSSGIDRVINFLVAGMTLFAPYAVNKFASLFQGISGGK